MGNPPFVGKQYLNAEQLAHSLAAAANGRQDCHPSLTPKIDAPTLL